MSDTPNASLEAIVTRARGDASAGTGPPPTEGERALLETLERHVSSEGDTLRAYDELARTSPDEHVRYVLRMILDDERRHHTVLDAMLDRVRAEVEWREPSAATPYVRPVQDHHATRNSLARLLADERADLRRVRSLKRRLRRQRDTSMLWLMADMLECDTRKHVRMLRFLRRTAPRS